ncbi:MAG TPA: hypothetical protein VMH80_24750 [Bryobacteraceae bacterium]|nr:hypothetical protein [Bryobacteraceae bacterium]
MTGRSRHISLALAIGIAVSLVAGARADTVSLNLSGLVNSDLTTYTEGWSYPQHGGPITIGGVPFTLATIGPNSDTAVIQSSTDYGADQTFSLNVGLFGVTSAFTLINTAFGVCGTTVGAVEFVGSSTTYTYDLTEGNNVRDHYNGYYCNGIGLSDRMIYFGFDRLDRQSIVLPDAFAHETLESIVFESFGQGVGGAPFLAAITLDPASNAVPEPVTWPLGLIALLAMPLVHRRRRTQQ